jgi:hypothetical protein
MASPFDFLLLTGFSLCTLFVLGSIAREAYARLKAGPVRFRLPLASLDKPRSGANLSSTMCLIVALLLLPMMFRTEPSAWFTPLLFLWIAVNILQSNIPRRDSRRWLVLASGLIGLLTGTMWIAAGYRQLSSGESLYGMPAWFLFLCSFALFAASVPQLLELVSGTRVREGGIEMLGTTRPWSQVVVRGWHERDDGFALRVSIVPSQPVPTLTGGDTDMIVPVPASERPALEEFLRWHVAIVG